MLNDARHPTSRRRQNHARTDRIWPEARKARPTAPMVRLRRLTGWSRNKAFHIPVFDKSQRRDGTRADFHYDMKPGACPAKVRTGFVPGYATKQRFRARWRFEDKS